MNPRVSSKVIGTALFLLLSAAALSAQTRSKTWMNGTWEGTGYQTDEKSTWTMELKVRGRNFSIEYPSLGCGGKWRLVSLGAWRGRFVERLDRGQDKCADRGNVTILRRSRNQIIFLYSYEGERAITASAILNRKP